MAKQIGFQATSTGGWGNQVLNVLFTVFIIAIVFGVMLVATVQTNSTLQSTQNQQDGWSTVSANSVNAVNSNSFNTGNVFLTWTGATQISSSNPAVVTIFGNTLTGAAGNTVGFNAFTKASASLTYTATSNAAALVSSTGNFYNISKVTVTGLLPGDSGAVATVTYSYFPFQPNNGLNSFPATTNVLTATGTTTVLVPNIGTTGQTPVQVFVALISYLVTLSNFVGIIILLAIIVVVIGVLYFFFGRQQSTSFGGGL